MKRAGTMKGIATLFVSISLSGCAGGVYPQLVYGNYFMGGDANCKRYNVISGTRIECLDKNGNSMGYRDAMTSQEVQAWQYQRGQQMEQLNQSLQQLGETFRQGGQAALQQSQQYSIPQVQSYSRSGVVTYRQVGDQVLGSNGINYRRVGDQFFGSNGISLRQVGSTLIASDGTTCQIISDGIICGN